MPPLDLTAPLDAREARGKVEIHHSTCPHDCPSTCSLEVEKLDARTIGRVRGAAGNDYTAGVVCAKVGRYAERVHHPDRLRTPLRRIGPKGSGRDGFVPISWDEALDEVAENFIRVARQHGSEAVWPYYYAGTMGHLQRDGIQRLRHVMRYSGQHSTFCITLADAGWNAGTGAKRGVDPRELAHSDLIVVWGGNPVSTQVNLMTHISRARKARGVPLVVVDPYRTPTAEQADIHLMLRPGTDGALACAVMHVLFAEGFADRDYMARYTDCPDDLERHLATRTPAWAAAITGLSVDEIVAFARLYGKTKKSFLRLGYGFSRTRNGAAQMHAAASLPAVTGAWQYEGGGALYANAALYKLDKTLIEGLDARDPSVRVLDQSRIGAILDGDAADLCGGPGVHAMLIQNTNPCVVAPDLGRVLRGFARDDLFVCVHEQFLTDTARMADIVLPATTFLEHDDFYTGGGHTYLQATKAVIEPLAEARPNHYVHCELAKRLGAEHPGFGMTAWELIDQCLVASGLPDAETMWRNHWEDRALPFRAAHYLDGFAHPDGKYHFRADWTKCGPLAGPDMPALPDHWDAIDGANDEHPFRLVTAPARSFLNSTFGETPGSRKKEGGRPTAKIHPDDVAALGLAADGLVRLGNARGSVLVHVEPFDGLQRGVVVVEGIWPPECFIEGRGINTLVSADRGRPNGGGVFHDTAVWLRPA
ncbi:MAG: molybdopterin oxidoreductase family protein [Alphaproteobacteria bacterium]